MSIRSGQVIVADRIRCCGHTGDLDDYGPSTYGDAFADVYDAWYAPIDDDRVCVEALARAAAGRAVLELGVGTGRLALPLARRNLAVTGVDASVSMVHRLVAKADGVAVAVLVADMAALPVRGPFGLVFVASNTFFNLPDEAAQQQALHDVARVLAPEGTFVVEAFVPSDEDDLGEDTTVEVRSVDDEKLVLITARRDTTRQIITGSHLEMTANRVQRRPWRVHYLSPSQLDDLASRAGLVLAERHADWAGTPFDRDSPFHVSRYRTNEKGPQDRRWRG